MSFRLPLFLYSCSYFSSWRSYTPVHSSCKFRDTFLDCLVVFSCCCCICEPSDKSKQDQRVSTQQTQKAARETARTLHRFAALPHLYGLMLIYILHVHFSFHSCCTSNRYFCSILNWWLCLCLERFIDNLEFSMDEGLCNVSSNIYIYIYTHTHIYIYMCVYTYIHTHTHMCILHYCRLLFTGLYEI